VLTEKAGFWSGGKFLVVVDNTNEAKLKTYGVKELNHTMLHYEFHADFCWMVDVKIREYLKTIIVFNFVTIFS